MSKFKVGDRVKCVREYPQWLTVGKEYVVTDVYPTPTVCVRGDEGMTGGFNPWYFELAESEKEQPKPEPTVLERVTSRIERSTLIYNYLDTKDAFEHAMAAYNEACQAIRDKLKDGERFVYTRYSEAYIVERDKDGFTVDKIDMV
jgi:hypothetical protein